MAGIWSSFSALRPVWISLWPEEALSHLRPARRRRGCSSGMDVLRWHRAVLLAGPARLTEGSESPASGMGLGLTGRSRTRASHWPEGQRGHGHWMWTSESEDLRTRGDGTMHMAISDNRHQGGSHSLVAAQCYINSCKAIDPISTFPVPQYLSPTAGSGRAVRLPERGRRARGRDFVVIERL